MLRHEQDAEDAFQATFLVLAKKATAIRKQESVGSWLYSVAFRVASKLRAVQARRKLRETPLGDDAPARDSEDLSWREVQLAVYAELDRLSDKYRAPLLLCYLQGKTRDEAAQQLGCGIGVLRGRLDRGRELLRTRLCRKGLALSAPFLALGMADTASAALLPTALFSSTVNAALCAAKTTVAAAVSAQAAALTQGVIQAMFLSKLKSLVLGVVTLAFLSTGVRVVSYRTLAQEPGSSAVPAGHRTSAAGNKANDETDVRKLRQEIERLRRELEETKAELLTALRDNVKLKTRAEAEQAKAMRQMEERVRYEAMKGLLEMHEKNLLEMHRKNRLEKQRNKTTNKIPDPNVAGLQPLHRIADLEPSKRPKATSPDGKRLVVADGTAIDLFDVETGKQIARSLGHNEAVSAVAFSPDGKLIASGSEDRSVILWYAATLKQIRKFSLPTPVSGVRFSPDGRNLTVSGSDRTQRVLDLVTGKELSVNKDQERGLRP
jgi:RNA polymerase sigma factor (sigma-70 family)